MNMHFPKLQLRSLHTKFLLPMVGLMLVSLLASTLAFVAGAQQTRNQLLDQRMSADQERVMQILAGRVEVVRSAAHLLAANPEVASALSGKTEDNLAFVDSRAVVVRNRFGLDLIQIFDHTGEAWTNLVLSDLYRVSSLTGQIGDDAVRVVAVEGRLLLLSRAVVWGDTGVVITGIDLQTELRRIASEENLLADVALGLGGTEVTSRDEGADLVAGPGDSVYKDSSLLLGDTAVEMRITCQTAEITQVMNAGLWIMISSSLLTTLLLIYVSSAVMRLMLQPIQRLAAVTQVVASRHQFEEIQQALPPKNLLGIGQNDEIGQLAASYGEMMAELRDLYVGLEAKVAARTQQLAASAEVARAATSSLDLDIILRTAVEKIGERFGLYFTGVFTFEPASGAAILRQAAGQEEIVFDENFYLYLPVEKKSHITTAIQARRAVVIQDVTSSSLYLPHPALPATRAEAVFPLIHGEEIVGALNVQSTCAGAFTPDLVETLSTLSHQIAVAIRNASLYDQQREIAKRLAEIDHLKSRFLSTVSHELRTPLNAIIGFSKLMLNEPATETHKADLTSIHQNGLYLLSLINDLLTLSQIEAGMMNLEWQPVSLQELVAEVVMAYRQQVGERPIHLEADLPADLPRIQADATRLRKAIDNLLSNAIKFTKVGQVSITATHNPQWVVVNISDTGIGIAPEDMDKLFRPFSQVDGTPARRFGGMGLGLNIARYIIELHGGKIWAESQVGSGATFSFVLPLMRPSNP